MAASTPSARKLAADKGHSLAPSSTLPGHDQRRALDLAMQLMAIPGTSGKESQAASFIEQRLVQAGLPASAIETDQAHRKSPLGGERGNLIVKFPGTLKLPRRLLMAHMDTVPLCVGCKPTLKGGVVKSADPATGLGADDRAGCAVVLNTALEILERGLPHPPLTLFWPVQEEVGLHGAQYCQLAQLGKPKLAFNWDGGAAEKITIGATGAYRLKIAIDGVASHAGVAPENGVSAVAIASLAVAELHRKGWHGLVKKGTRRGTSNVGCIQGGGATNVVTDRVELKAECRSHDPEFRKELLAAIVGAFERAADAVTSALGAKGKVAIESRLDYESFRLDENEPAVQAACAAVASLGGKPLLAISNGGLDANWLSARGIPTVTLGCGQQNVHTIAETLDVAAFQSACAIGLKLATASA